VGGPGSTRWHGVSVKDVVERRERLDVLSLLHQGCLEPRTAGKHKKHHYLMLEKDEIMLWGGWDYFLQHIFLVWVPCHYGGRRPMFRCACGRRARFLYAHKSRYVCRTCAHLNFVCQQLRPRRRAEQQMRKLLVRLGHPGSYHLPWPDLFPPRRKRGVRWLHPWTHRRLYEQYMARFWAYSGIEE
jgi:hypothetical protein